MSWFKRIGLAAVLGAALAVSGCGFQPLYGETTGGADLKTDLAAVSVAPLPNRIGQLLRNALEQRLERSGGRQRKEYVLQVSLEERVEDLGLRKDNTATRANLRLIANAALVKGDKVVWRTLAEGVSSYNILDNQYATVISQKDARERAVQLLADDVVRRLAVFMAGRGAESP